MHGKVIIFDMDGVLIDSEPAYLEMNQKMFREFGIEMDDENYKALVGMPSLPMWTMLKEKYNLSNDVSEFLNKEKRRMNEILDSDIISRPITGIYDILKKLKDNKLLLSVASSSAKDNINFILNKLNLSGFFDYIISGEDVVNGKPAPDIFLKVSSRFNQPPGNCFVIEDSTNGITAANKAGMHSIGFTNDHSNSQNLAGAELTVNNFGNESIDIIFDFINNN